MRSAIRERTEKMMSLLKIYSAANEICSHGSVSFYRAPFARRSYYSTRDIQIPDNIDWIIWPRFCEAKKKINESQDKYHDAKLYI